MGRAAGAVRLGRGGVVADTSMPSGRRGRRRSPTAGLLVLVLLLAALLAACGNGSSSFDKKAAPAQIQHAYAVLFNFSNPSVEDKVAVIQDGARLRGAIREALASPLAALAKGAKVTGVKLLEASACKDAGVPSPCARVGYDLLGAKGSALFKGASGYAVYEGKWLVARTTICGLLTTMNETLGKKGTPAGC